MIPYGRQNIDEDDIEAVTKALKEEYLTTGPLVNNFELKLQEVTGAPTVVVSSGTAALHCAYKAINLGPGDEVITPPITFVATQATAINLGAKVVFCDVQQDTANLDPSVIEKLINKNTKAIVAVDYAGHPADLDELSQIASKHSIVLIEDAAHSLGSTYKGRKVGSIADITTFSFFPTKNITTGEGGAVSSNNKKFLERAKKFSRQGLVREKESFLLEETGPWHQEVHEFGLNYRLPDILCALGISQLDKLEKFKKRRQEIWNKYEEGFSEDYPYIRTPSMKQDVEPMWHLYPIRVLAYARERIFRNLNDLGIRVQVNYIPAYKHPAFELDENIISACTNSEIFYKEEISLPIFPSMTDDQIDFVIANVKKSVLKYSNLK